VAFTNLYKKVFERDFLPSSPSFPTTVTDLIQRLKRWKAHLSYRLGGRSQVNMRMEVVSPTLSRFYTHDIEASGAARRGAARETAQLPLIAPARADPWAVRSRRRAQHGPERAPQPLRVRREGARALERGCGCGLTDALQVQHLHGFSHRRIGMRGTDGKSYHFVVQYSILHIIRHDERMMQ
jgi:hypothetical protein